MIPEGETIRRHRAKIEEHGLVWWGWIKRGHERVPKELLLALVEKLEEGPRPLYLFHSAERRLYSAKVDDVSAFPGGALTQTPEVQKTPSYMAEAEVPAWFKLISIDEPLNGGKGVRITGLPTLETPRRVDTDLLDREINDLTELGMSTATLWEATTV